MTPAEERELEMLDILLPSVCAFGFVDSKTLARWIDLGAKKAMEKTDETLAQIAEAEGHKRWRQLLRTYDLQPKEKTLTIKSTVQVAKARHEYPKLMISREWGFVVLMTEDRVGVVVHPTDAMPSKTVGYGSSSWTMDAFDPFHGTITLEA